MPSRPDLVVAARAIGWSRVALGSALVLAPTLAGRPLAGAAARSRGSTVLTRAAGIRDVFVGVGVLRARDDGDRAFWVAAGTACDGLDLVAVALAWPVLDRRWRAAVALGALAATVAGACLAVRLGTPEPPEGSQPAPHVVEAIDDPDEPGDAVASPS